jgi:4-amino-4-deoxy-L-arabinose transferase-like glycosyltransferase
MTASTAPAQDVHIVRRNTLSVDWRWVGLAAIGAAYLATRLALLWRFPPFADESVNARLSAVVADDPSQRFIALTDGRGPLLTWLGGTGIHFGLNPLTAVRLVSILAGVLTLAAVMLVARRLGGDRAAVAAGAVYVALPIFVVHGVLGIHEPLVIGVLMLALYLQIRLAERPSFGVGALLGAALAAAMLTKESGRFALVLLPLSLLVFDWRSPDRLPRFGRWLAAALLALAITGLGYSVLFLTPLYDQLGAIRAGKHAYHPLSEAVAHAWTYFNHNRAGFRLAITGYFTWPLLVAGLVGAVVALRARPRLTLVLAAWIVVPFAAATIISLEPYPRYILPALPLWAVFIALGLVTVARGVRGLARRRLGPRWAAAAGAGAAVALGIPALASDADIVANPGTHRYPGWDDWQFVTGWPAGTETQHVSDEIRRRTGGRGATITQSQFGHNAFEHQLPRHRYRFQLFNPPDHSQRFFIDNGGSVPDLAGFRLVGRWHRPRGGQTLSLYERVAARPG